MVDLVLDHPRLESRRLDLERLPGRVVGLHAYVQRALDVDDDARQAEAALLGGLDLLRGPLDLRVHEGGRRRIGPGLEDEQPPHHAELGRGEPDAERVVHDRHHPLDLGGQLGPEVLDG
jgi:hypothetical protein